MMKEEYIRFVQEVRQFIPQERIYTDGLRRLAWGTDAGFYRLTPQVVVRADGEEEVARLLKLAGQRGLPVTFRAAGTSLSGQAISDSILIVAGKHWEKYDIAPDHERITLQPGIIGQRVNELLAPYGRRFAPDPASIRSAMVGGIVMNNASGMNCGTHANSDKVMTSARVILADGTLLDTADPVSRASFEATHPEFLARIRDLRDRVRANRPLAERIRRKYAIKNVTGLNLLPLLRQDDPFDIIAHLMVGSEGTLAFLAQVTMKTEREQPCKASAMLYFRSIQEACRAVVKMKGLEQACPEEEEGTMRESDNNATDRLLVKSAELLDYKSLSSVDDPVFLRYKGEVAASALPGVEPGDERGLTAVLTETKAGTPHELRENIAAIEEALKEFETYVPVRFTDRPEEYSRYWAIRSGIFPSVGGTRRPGTTCLIEDVAFHIEDLPQATADLQQLIARHGYDDACIYGHALEGNYHFIINQSFGTDEELKRYEALMEDVKKLVVDRYDGSLKAEHGTGRNMAPYVRQEWGEEAYRVMKEIKELFDPKGLLNPGVIFNDDPKCHLKHIKSLTPLNAGRKQGAEEARRHDTDEKAAEKGRNDKGAEACPPLQADKCIECGFCEVNCLSCGFTLSARQRIVIQREIARLERLGEHREAEQLKKQYRYPGNRTCAGDGLCSLSCPMGINTGDLTHLIRREELPPESIGYKAGDFAARHFAGIKSTLRPVLALADLGHTLLGSKAMSALTRGMHRLLGVPQWTPAMPKSFALHLPRQEKGTAESGSPADTVVYFPSCINQTMGLARKSPVEQPLAEKTIALLEKAGYRVVFPKGMERLCCGTIWESKGMTDIADRKSRELEEALWEASRQGEYPVLCDQSPCLHRMRETIRKIHLYEPAEFIHTFLRDRLEFTPVDRPVALHITCSMRRMGLADTLIAVARLCSTQVFVPEEVGCCGFAGDRGFTHPELNAYALRKLRPQIEKQGIEIGYSNSRTCEIGLTTHAGIPYVSIVYLVDECTTPKATNPNTLLS